MTEKLDDSTFTGKIPKECNNKERSQNVSDESSYFAQITMKELLFKFVIIGDYGVGKTSIIRRYVDDIFLPSYKITIGADFNLKSIIWNESTRINLQLWDIAGHERFGTLTGVYYRYAVAAVIVFDLTRPETFTSVHKWLIDLRRKVCLPCGGSIPVIVLANKADVTTETVPNEIIQFCSEFNIMAWFITSAKNNMQIDEAMRTLVNAAFLNNKLKDDSTKKDCDKINGIVEQPIKLTNRNEIKSEKSTKTCCQI